MAQTQQTLNIGRAIRGHAAAIAALVLVIGGIAAVFAGAAILGPVAVAMALIVVGALVAAIGLLAVDVAPRPRRRR